jgi:cell division septum initiation protein DivIVA
MSVITNLSSQQLRHIADLKEKIDSLQNQLNRLVGAAASGSTTKRKSGMSAAGRARIAAAQRARWAKVKGAGKSAKATRKLGRKLSAAARAKIAAAARARWAKVKAAGKKRL